MKTKIFSLFLMLIISIGILFASDTQVNGIWYYLHSSTLTAEVTYQGTSYSAYTNEYSGAVTIPSSVTYNNKIYAVTSIEWGAFRDCTGLTSVTIPNSVTSIGEGAFEDCTGLTSITIPNSVTSIGQSTFRGCSSLPVIDNIRYADTYLIEAVDTTLSTYAIKEGTRWIAHFAFNKCKDMISITIPESVIDIGKFPFLSCFNLMTINVAGLNPNYSSLDGVLFDKEKTKLIKFPIKKADNEYNIPNSVVTIDECAFMNCRNLNKVTIPIGVTNIGNQAFYVCTNLTSADIPNTVVNIGNSAFMHCKITSAIIPDNVYKIGGWAFCACTSLNKLTIGANVTDIGWQAFDYCTNLSSIICKSEIPPTIEYEHDNINAEIFRDLDKSICKLFVPKRVIAAYKNHWQWKQFTNILPIEDYQSVEEMPFTEIQTSKQLMKDGQILILRGDKTYTLTGQEVK